MNENTNLSNENNKQDIPIGFRAHDKQLSVPEEVIVYLNELNAANMVINAKLEAHAANPLMRFINGKFAIVDEKSEKETILFTSDDWYLIGEFRIINFDENNLPNDVEFIWGWGLRPDDPHTKPVTTVVEELPYGLQPLTFPLVKFEDIGLIEIIKSYAFHIMNLEYIFTKWSEKLQSWGIFGVKNIVWEELTKPKSPEWEKILTTVRNLITKKKVEFPDLEHKTIVESVWREPEILTMVAEYRRMKDEAYQHRIEITERIRQAMINPTTIITQMMTDNMSSNAQNSDNFIETPINPKITQEELNYAMNSVQRAFDKVENQMDEIGNDMN